MTDEAAVARACAAGPAPSTSLVNNAGAAESAPLARTGLDALARDARRQRRRCLPCSCRALVPGMVERGFGPDRQRRLDGRPARLSVRHGLLRREARARRLHPGARARAGGDAGDRQRGLPGLHRDAAARAHASSGSSRRPAATPTRPAARSLRENPQGRFVQPDEVASAVAWLCEPAQARRSPGGELVVAGAEVV